MTLELGNSTELLDRTELRFILPAPDRFLELARPLLREVTYSPNHVVQTVYFNNDDHTVPFGTSLKARRYLPERTASVEGAGNFIVETKRSEGSRSVKQRASMTLGAAADHFNNLFPTPGPPFRPYTLSEYLRRHYIPHEASGVRITIDDDVRYYFFERESHDLVELGGEGNYVRIEVKVAPGAATSAAPVVRLLRELGGFPVTSKKYASYTFLKRRRERVHGRSSFYQELGDVEIEAKMEASADHARRWLFYELKEYFLTRDAYPFRLAAEYPHVHETASINRYYEDGDQSFKLIAKGHEGRVIRKGSASYCTNSANLDCIIRRVEEKGERIPVWSDLIRSSKLVGELYRKRRAFWIEHLLTKRIYHVSLDECRDESRCLFQVEVEYAGGYEAPAEPGEGAVVEELAAVTRDLLAQFPGLTPTGLTKFSWLASSTTPMDASL